ncbi:unnamed protein product, partial [Symbiodinium pilosum]
ASAEGQSWNTTLRLAASAGAIAVATAGAEPSLPTRTACDALAFGATPRSQLDEERCQAHPEVQIQSPAKLHFSSRLNSMKARLDLWRGSIDTLGLVERQGTVKGNLTWL